MRRWIQVSYASALLHFHGRCRHLFSADQICFYRLKIRLRLHQRLLRALQLLRNLSISIAQFAPTSPFKLRTLIKLYATNTRNANEMIQLVNR